MSQRPKRRLTNGLMALGSAAVIAVYTAGYVRTEPAAASAGSAGLATPTILAAGLSGAATPAPTPTATVAPARRQVAPTATPSPAAPTTAAAPAATATLRDGRYTGTGSSRHGSIEATLVIEGGRIVSAEITSCGTRYPCAKVAALPGQVVARQSAEVDLISRATDSSVAYRSAVMAALARAR